MIIIGDEYSLENIKALAGKSPKNNIEKIRESLNDEKKPIFDAALAGKNIYCAGEGGCGKTYLIKSIVKAMREQNKTGKAEYTGSIIVAAPTGKAALAIDGVTVNRVLGIGCDLAISKNRKNHSVKTKNLKHCRAIIIDEASMLRVDVLDSLFLVVKKLNEEREKETDWRKKLPPCSVLLFGDFGQLCPIYGKNITGENNLEILRKFYKDKYNYDIGDGYAFETMHWKDFNFEEFKLRECMRNEHQRQKDILSYIRKGGNGWGPLEELNLSCHQGQYENTLSIYPYNKEVEAKNEEELNKLPGEPVSFPPVFDGNIYEELKNETPTLKLKVGAQIILTANSYESANHIINPESNRCSNQNLFVNGTTAVITSLHEDKMHPENEEIWMETEHHFCGSSWKISFGLKRRYEPVIDIRNGEPKIVGKRGIFDIALGYAISVHKSQGMSVDRINVCNISSGDYADGLGYVALSRCTSFEGIGLDGWVRPGDIRASKKVRDWEREHFGDDDIPKISPMTDEFGTVGVDGYQGFGLFALPYPEDDNTSDLAELEGNIWDPEVFGVRDEYYHGEVEDKAKVEDISDFEEFPKVEDVPDFEDNSDIWSMFAVLNDDEY